MNQSLSTGFLRCAGASLAVMLALGGWAAPAAADPPPGYKFLSYDEGLKQARASGKRIFLYFGREGCAWCEIVNKNALSHAGLKKTYSDHYVLVYVDSESGRRLTLPSGERITEAELGVRMKAFATPIFAYLEPSGDTIFQVPGIQTTKDFESYDRYVRGGIYKNKDIKQFLAEHP